MGLPPADVMSGILDELESFEALVRDLDDSQLATPSRCDGWAVRDVVAHVIGSLAEVAAGRAEGLGAADLNERLIRERGERTGSQLADELATIRAQAAALLGSLDLAAWLSPAPGRHRGTLVDGVETLWHDAFIHGDDIRAALGLPSIEGPGLGAALSHVTRELHLRGWPQALAFVMVATGRADPASLTLDRSVDIYGDGADLIADPPQSAATPTVRLHEMMPLCATLGIEATALADTAEVVVSMPWQPGLCTTGGVLHGGAVMSLADAAGGLCAFLNLPDGASGTTTIQSHTNFLRAVTEGDVEARARPLHAGRTVIVVETEVRDRAGKLVAKSVQSQAVLRA
jgi:1,4-dihydroxy-2-naphthoyl-CoA hydrolase